MFLLPLKPLLLDCDCKSEAFALAQKFTAHGLCPSNLSKLFSGFVYWIDGFGSVVLCDLDEDFHLNFLLDSAVLLASMVIR